MKTILVDALYGLVRSPQVLDEDMQSLLEQHPNRKIVLTGADD